MRDAIALEAKNGSGGIGEGLGTQLSVQLLKAPSDTADLQWALTSASASAPRGVAQMAPFAAAALRTATRTAPWWQIATATVAVGAAS